MKIALFSDIHANLPALEAFFVDMEIQKPDMVFCLGDLIGYNIWPNEVINEVRKRKIPTILGNHEEEICKMPNDDSAIDQGAEIGSSEFTNRILGNSEKAYLQSLPSHIKLEFKFNGTATNLLMVHGSPRRVNEYIFEDADEQDLRLLMKEANASVMCFGHTHKPFHRILKDDNGLMMHAINLGSLGKPKDGDPRASYVLLELSAEGIAVEFKRVAYDVEKAANAVEESPLSNKYADMLRRAF